MDKRELEIVVVSGKDLPVQTVASSDAKAYAIISLANGPELLQWKTSEAEDVTNPKWNKQIKVVLDEGAIQRDSVDLLIEVCIKKENATDDEEVGYLSLPQRSFLPHVGRLGAGDYPLGPIQGSLTLKLGVKLLDKLIPDESMAATQPPVMSMRANLPTPYLHSSPPANTVVGPMIPVNYVRAPYYPYFPPLSPSSLPSYPGFPPGPVIPVNSVIPLYSPYSQPLSPPPYHPYSQPLSPPSVPSYPGHSYTPIPSFYEGLSILQLLLQGAEIINSFQGLMSTLGDGGAGSFQDFVMSTLGDWGAGSFQDFVLGDWGAGSM